MDKGGGGTAIKVRGILRVNHVTYRMHRVAVETLLLLLTGPAVFRVEVSSPAHMLNATQIHTCKWDWCNLNYVTTYDLERHVILEHVSSESPVQVSQTSVKLRADGQWVSLERGMLFKTPTDPTDASMDASITAATDSNVFTASASASASFPVPTPPDFNDFINYEHDAPSPNSATVLLPAQPTPAVRSQPVVSSPSASFPALSTPSEAVPTQPPAPALSFGLANQPLPFGAAPGATPEKEHKRLAGVRHSWGQRGPP